jgi:flagellar basal-body rod protein FlgC
MGANLPAVKAEVVEDTQGLKVVFDPSHPDADESGKVTLPNVNVVEEMVDLLRATRSYEANVTAFNSAKGMALKALEIGNK